MKMYGISQNALDKIKTVLFSMYSQIKNKNLLDHIDRVGIII
jgi:hypothetical protein